VDEAPRVRRDQDRRVVELRFLLDQPADDVPHLDRVLARQPADRREADVPTLVAAVPPRHLIDVQVGHAGLHPVERVLKLFHVLGRALRAPHLDPGDRLEGGLYLGEAMVDDRLVAVERKSHQPAPDLELLRHVVDRVVGHRIIALVPGRTARDHGRHRDRVPELWHVLDRPVEHQPAQRVHDRGQIVVLPRAQPEGHVALRPRHQPDAELRDNSEVRLHEQLVERRAETALVDMPGAVVRHRSHAGAEQLAVCEHDLHAAVGGHVLRLGKVCGSVLEEVADHPAPAQVGDRDHQLVAAGLDRVVEVEPADAGLDDAVGELLVDLEHSVHVPERDDHRAFEARRGPAVAVVHPAAVRPERDPALVRDPDDRLHLLDRRGHHHR
jgi:hypothetical protein